jgi:hypothetical protein
MLLQIQLPDRLNSQVPYDKMWEVSITILVSISYKKSYDVSTKGYNFQVCAGTGIVGAVSPHCQMFYRSQEGDAMVTVTP